MAALVKSVPESHYQSFGYVDTNNETVSSYQPVNIYNLNSNRFEKEEKRSIFDMIRRWCCFCCVIKANDVHESIMDDPSSSLAGHIGRSYTLNKEENKQIPRSPPAVNITRNIENDCLNNVTDNDSIKSTTTLLISNEQEASSISHYRIKVKKQNSYEPTYDSGNNSESSTIRTDEVYMSDSVSPGHATLPRRSNSPLPHDRDVDRDRFPINRSGLQVRSESMASVYSGAGEGLRGSVTVKGEVQFSLLYNYRLGALEVGVKRCRDLAPIDVKRNRSDPYVKVYLLPDKSKAGKRKTKVKKNTLNPVFEETLSFVQPLASLSSRTLWLSAWHADMFGRNDFLGEVTLPLADVVFDDPAPMWYKLHERTEQFDEQHGSRGDVIIGLKFELKDAARGKGTLHVLVKEAKNLVATKPNGLCDVFCKSYLLPERGRLAKQKTTVVRRSLNPRWEHTFIYRGLTMQELATRALELSIWDRDRLASNDFMGAVRLSLATGTYMGAAVNWMDSVGKEITLWQNMMQQPNLWVEGSLPLRPQLIN
ncbi:jg3375 [Pararge aegeria aegeria]|uniref:Jg3375 protein n=1 Tax=Pararge aegeria aegeria TaxID=348720 RepID=A0A8S4RR16_9NEOP|nr:jg3375 [Pararge aegeria aegeria]